MLIGFAHCPSDRASGGETRHLRVGQPSFFTLESGAHVYRI
ncbi:hypothetical protein WP3W19E03_42110 [Aeromonas veronii]|uniref:Uncharacterized protein n=1 Tax=Aeromonas veronii TaxID=654 RepID=A0A6S5C9L9_AERVE|nr:hypothetical protein WP3W19E03_42110 [Aeromonas veronii]